MFEMGLIRSNLILQQKEESPKPRLTRCHSETEAMIKSALNRIADEPDLVGDCSRVSSCGKL